jgi:putative ABC transport system permease protein
MAYAVAQRTQEIGIRMALGARPANVLGDILLKGMGMTAVGVAAGIAGALVLARLVSSMLVDVSAADPLTFGSAALFLLGVALLASYFPARRATKVDPAVAFRCE